MFLLSSFLAASPYPEEEGMFPEECSPSVRIILPLCNNLERNSLFSKAFCVDRPKDKRDSFSSPTLIFSNSSVVFNIAGDPSIISIMPDNKSFSMTSALSIQPTKLTDKIVESSRNWPTFLLFNSSRRNLIFLFNILSFLSASYATSSVSNSYRQTGPARKNYDQVIKINLGKLKIK